MLEYLIRRLGWAVLTIITVTVVLFTIMYSMPGDPIRMITDPRMPPEQLEALKARWGLDRPPHIQYLTWAYRVLQGDFGTSISNRQPVRYLIATRFPYTMALTLTALLVRYLIGVAVGLIVAVKRGSWLDSALVISTVTLRSIPNFWLGIMLMLLFAVRLQWLPISGYDGPKSLILPVAALTLPWLADTMRITRSEVLEVMREDYVTTAHAKGVPFNAVMLRHVLRNALIPVTVMFFLSLPWLIGGAVVIESVFAWPGMGRLLWRSILAQDVPVVQGIVLIIAILTVLCNTIGDVVCAFLDPTIREEYK